VQCASPEIARNCPFLPLNAGFTGNTLATDLVTSKPDFFQNCVIAASRIRDAKNTPMRVERNFEFFHAVLFSARETETLIHRYPFRRGSSMPTAHSATSAACWLAGG
jgi:hypothetical protein